jgi:hypothetical protein
MREDLRMFQRGPWEDCNHINLPNGGSEVLFMENATTAEDEMFTNTNWRVPVSSWRELVRKLDHAGESPVSCCGVTLTRLPDRTIRVEWVKKLTFDLRSFPPDRPGLLTVTRADLVID